MLKVQDKSLDGLGIFLMPSQLLSYFRQAREIGLTVPAFNADILDSETIVKESPENVNGTFLSHVGVTEGFRKRYREKFGNDIHIGSAAQAYDIAEIAGDLFGKLERKLSNDEVMERLETVGPRTGVTGTFEYSNTPGAGKEYRMPVSLREVRDYKIETISEDTGY